MRRPLLTIAIVLSALATAGSAAAATFVSNTLSGFEVPPISSTRGTFVGTAAGDVRFSWRAQIEHRPLSTGATVPVTGGRMLLLSPWGRTLAGSITGGSVSVVDRGRNCSDQLYRVEVTTTVGTFTGTLTHNRRELIGHCLITSATIRGKGAFALTETFLAPRLPKLP
jgi:hypothetical protein